MIFSFFKLSYFPVIKYDWFIFINPPETNPPFQTDSILLGQESWFHPAAYPIRQSLSIWLYLGRQSRLSQFRLLRGFSSATRNFAHQNSSPWNPASFGFHLGVYTLAFGYRALSGLSPPIYRPHRANQRKRRPLPDVFWTSLCHILLSNDSSVKVLLIDCFFIFPNPLCWTSTLIRL